MDNGQFGFLRIENVQNALNIDNEKLVTENFRLFSNFPNPFNSSTKINYQLLNQNNIRLNIFDTNGNAVIELVNEFKKQEYIQYLGKAPMTNQVSIFHQVYIITRFK